MENAAVGPCRSLALARIADRGDDRCVGWRLQRASDLVAEIAELCRKRLPLKAGELQDECAAGYQEVARVPRELTYEIQAVGTRTDRGTDWKTVPNGFAQLRRYIWYVGGNGGDSAAESPRER